MSVVGGNQQWRFTPLVASVGIGAHFQKQIQHVDGTSASPRRARRVQRCVQIVLELAIDQGTLLQAEPDRVSVPFLHGTFQVQFGILLVDANG